MPRSLLLAESLRQAGSTCRLLQGRDAAPSAGLGRVGSTGTQWESLRRVCRRSPARPHPQHRAPGPVSHRGMEHSLVGRVSLVTHPLVRAVTTQAGLGVCANFSGIYSTGHPRHKPSAEQGGLQKSGNSCESGQLYFSPKPQFPQV